MSDSRRHRSDRFYGALLRVLPFDFRSEFGSDMEETFRAQCDETRERGGRALLRIWWTTIADILRMAPREHASVLWQDTRFALRMMRKNAGYTAAAVLILALAIGVNTSIFSAVNSVLLKPLPYARGNGLVVLRQPATRLGVADEGFSVQEIRDYRAQSRSLSALVEYHGMQFTLLGRNEAHRVRTGVVSANFFEVLGVKPLLGRTFVPEDDQKDAPPVLVLSYEYWKEAEGGAPNIIGKKFQMNDRPHTVIGVLPAIPQYPDENDLYMPTTACPTRSSARVIESRGIRMLSAFGRIQPEVTVEHCRAEMATISQRLQQDHPEAYPPKSGFSGSASALLQDLTKEARPMLLLLLGAAGFVLLIACANVANLILARMSRREQELVIRTAVGAGAGRLLRQLLTESLILAMLAAGLGVLFAAGSMRLLAQFAEMLTPRAREIGIDGWALAFAVVCATVTTMVFGSVAALYSRQDVAGGLKEGSRASMERSRHLLRSGLIVAQVAFSYVLLIGAGLMVRSFMKLERVDPGFTPQHVLAVGFNLNWSRYQGAEAYRKAGDRLLAKIQAEPGIQSAAVSSSFPMDPENRNAGQPGRIRMEGDARPETELPTIDSLRSASPDYFRTLGIPVIAGRGFLDSDRADSLPVVILNRTLARSVSAKRDPLGRRLSGDGGKTWATIVGVVADTKEFGPDRDTPFQAYVPHQQQPFGGTLVVRTAGDPGRVAAAVRRVIHEQDPETAIRRVVTLEQARADSVASPRTTTRLLGLFAGLAFVIAVAGIWSMLALWVRQRNREIGIRMALGADRSDILRAVLRQGMVRVGMGLALGLGGAVVLTRFLERFLFQVDATDLKTYVAVSVLLGGAALAACFAAARRATRIDPQVALRCD